jgi:polysaccharide export outer membrane protein
MQPKIVRGRPLWLALCAMTLACSHVGDYVWADTLPEVTAKGGDEYVLGPGDVVNIRVFNQDNVSGRTRIRPDGKVTIPFVNDVPAAGRTTREVAASVQTALRSYINQAVVTVYLEEVAPTQLSVLGEVARPGVYSIDRGQGVLRAIAAAGGLTEFAHKDRIFVVRAGQAAQERIRFSLDGLSAPGSRSARFILQRDDVIVVQ